MTPGNPGENPFKGPMWLGILIYVVCMSGILGFVFVLIWGMVTLGRGLV